MKHEKEPTHEPTVIDDSIIAGLLLAKGHQVIPDKDSKGRVVYRVSGDVSRTMSEIYANSEIGLMDVLRSIKTARSMIFEMRNR